MHAFLGIPDALPPIGALRLQPPVAASSWTGVLQATVFGPSAPQLWDGPLSDLVPGMTVGPTSEDRLTLNLWAPARSSGPLPVPVWFHGGAFVVGGSALPTYDGALLAREQGLVLVSINYRLGIQRRLAPGVAPNCGLRDQALALRWVAERLAGARTRCAPVRRVLPSRAGADMAPSHA